VLRDWSDPRKDHAKRVAALPRPAAQRIGADAEKRDQPAVSDRAPAQPQGRATASRSCVIDSNVKQPAFAALRRGKPTPRVPGLPGTRQGKRDRPYCLTGAGFARIPLFLSPSPNAKRGWRAGRRCHSLCARSFANARRLSARHGGNFSPWRRASRRRTEALFTLPDPGGFRRPSSPPRPAIEGSRS
jgi:hypothetical protein